MQNKLLISKMRDNAELAWASYGYFHLVRNSGSQSFIELKKENSQANSNEDFSKKETTLIDIMDSTYKNYEVYCFNPKTKKEEKIGTLKGDMTPTQAKRFFERYELIHHIPNTLSGFSATIFYDIKESNTTTNTKESEKHFEYILSFRGTESTREIV